MIRRNERNTMLTANTGNMPMSLKPNSKPIGHNKEATDNRLTGILPMANISPAISVEDKGSPVIQKDSPISSKNFSDIGETEAEEVEAHSGDKTSRQNFL